MSKQKLLFLCVYLTALVLMGIMIQLYIKFYLADINMNIPKISVLFTLQFFIKIYLAEIYMNATWVSAPLTIFILITIVLFVRAYWIYRKIPKDQE